MKTTFFEDLGKRIGETAEVLGNKANEAVEIQKIKGQIRSLERNNENDLADLGRIVYDRFVAGEPVDEETADYCEAIQSRMESIEEYEKRISDMKGAYHCVVCGKEIGKGMAYCPYCGEKVPEEEMEDDDFVVEEDAADKTCGTVEKAAEAAEDAAEKTADAVGDAAEKVEEVVEGAAEKAEEVVEGAVEKAADVAEDAAEAMAQAAEGDKENAEEEKKEEA